VRSALFVGRYMTGNHHSNHGHAMPATSGRRVASGFASDCLRSSTSGISRSLRLANSQTKATPVFG